MDSPGPGVMQIRAAFTETTGSNLFTGHCYYAVPPARAFSQLKSLATGTQAFVGKAAFEGEVVDSQTGERLIAAIGARAGGKTLKTEMSSWRDVKAAVHVWAEDVRVREDLITPLPHAREVLNLYKNTLNSFFSYVGLKYKLLQITYV